LAKIKADAEQLAEKISGLTITIGAKTSTTGTIFGSVNNIQVAEALEKQGFNIDRKIIYEVLSQLSLCILQKSRLRGAPQRCQLLENGSPLTAESGLVQIPASPHHIYE